MGYWQISFFHLYWNYSENLYKRKESTNERTDFSPSQTGGRNSGICDCIYIPHFHKEPKLSDEDIQELGELLPDSSRLFKETSDYRSLGVFSNFDYSVIIGSDVQDWNKYETSKFADIRLPVQTFEQFCLLAKKDVQIIDTLLNQKRKKEIPVSPYKKVNFKLPFYEDINIIFGQKGTGKTEILESLKKYYIENGI